MASATYRHDSSVQSNKSERIDATAVARVGEDDALRAAIDAVIIQRFESKAAPIPMRILRTLLGRHLLVAVDERGADQSAAAKTKRIEDVTMRRELENMLARLAKRLTKITPKRGAAAVALDEATALVSKLITNRVQAQNLIERLRKLCK